MATTKDAFTLISYRLAHEADLIRGANVTCHRKH